MAREKSTMKKAQKEQGDGKELSVIRKKGEATTGIRILFQRASAKMTARGRGDLFYELGVDDGTKAAYIRISGNASSGAFSHEWIELIKIQSLLVLSGEQGKSFSAVAMDSLFTRRSANNCGYLAAILATEKVLSILPGKPVMLGQGDWEPLWNKIKKLEGSEVSLTDHIAIAARQRAEHKAQAAASRGQDRQHISSEPAATTAVSDNESEEVEEALLE